MPDQTNEQLNRWAAEFLDWFVEITDPETGEMMLRPPDFVHDLGVCPPVLERINEEVWDVQEPLLLFRYGWNPVQASWTYGNAYCSFSSPKSEPGRCIVEAAMYVFPEGEATGEMIDYDGIWAQAKHSFEDFIERDNTMMRALIGSTLNRLKRERAKGNMLTICPNCHRQTSEINLMEVKGIIVCPGLKGQAQCKANDFLYDLPFEGNVV